MAAGLIEHVNVTVADPERTARMLVDLFGWAVRWKGPSALGGHTIHVGTEAQYLAVYTPENAIGAYAKAGAKTGGLNHIGVVVDDLDAAETRVQDAGFEPFSHGDYTPGRRFYFLDADGIEYEVVSYA
ncbi:MAG: VOC family protein [Pseudomonadota bacterium]